MRSKSVEFIMCVDFAWSGLKRRKRYSAHDLQFVNYCLHVSKCASVNCTNSTSGVQQRYVRGTYRLLGTEPLSTFTKSIFEICKSSTLLRCLVPW